MTAGTETLRPASAGDIDQLTAVGGSPNWSVVADQTNTTYLNWVTAAANTVNEWRKALYLLSSPTGGGVISQVNFYYIIRNNGSASKGIFQTHGRIYDNGEESDGTGWGRFVQVYNTNPFTGLGWTWDEVKALQTGVNTAKTTTPPVWDPAWADCSELYVTISYDTPSISHVEGYTHDFSKRGGVAVFSTRNGTLNRGSHAVTRNDVGNTRR